MSPDSSCWAPNEQEKKPKKKSASSASKFSKFFKSTYRKCWSKKVNSDDYKVHRHNKGSKGMTVLKPMNIHFTEALNYKSYRLVRQSQENNGHISGSIAKWANHMDVQMKSAVLKHLDSILFFLSCTTSRRYVILMACMKERPWGYSNISWRTSPELLSNIVYAPRKTNIRKKRGNEHILSGLELPESLLYNSQGENWSRGWSYKLYAAQTHVWYQVFIRFVWKSSRLCSFLWRCRS